MREVTIEDGRVVTHGPAKHYPLCHGGNVARFTRPRSPSYHCGDPSCTCMQPSSRERVWDDATELTIRVQEAEAKLADALARLATVEAERNRLRAVESHRAEILNALAYCSHERILDLLDFPGFQLESLTEAEEQRAAFKAAGIALSDLLYPRRPPTPGGQP